MSIPGWVTSMNPKSALDKKPLSPPWVNAFPATFAAEILATLKAKAILLLKLNSTSNKVLFDTYKPTLHRRGWMLTI